MVSGVTSGTNPLADYYNNFKSAQEAKTTADEAKVTAETAKSTAETNKAAASTTLEKENSDVTELNKKISGVDAEIQSLSSTISSYMQAMKGLDSEKDADQISELNQKIADLQAKLDEKNAEIAELRTQLEQEEREVSDAQEKFDLAVQQENDAESILATAETAAREADVKLTEAETEYTSKKAELEAQGYEFDEVGNVVKEPETEEAKTRGAEETSFVPMTEAEAKEAGYTVISENCTGAELLKLLESNPSGKFILMGNIDLEGVNWTPVGNEQSPFTGEFNGNGFDIKNLKIEVAVDEAKNIGLFGVTENALIQNMNLVDAIIEGKTDLLTGTENAGLLIGLAKGTSVDNVTVSGEVSGSAQVGGMIGAINDKGDEDVNVGNSMITNCHSDVDVISQFYAGGLIGYVYGTEDRSEDHRGIASKSMIIRDCSTTGSATAGEESVGGIIGEADKTIITLDRCSSDMDLYWANMEDDSDLSFLLETGRIGGMVGNINGTYITLANCEFEGTLNGDTEFQSEVYGWYMDDSHVTIYDLPAGLPADDILNIDGVDGMRKVTQSDGTEKYECTVSTMSGLDKMVAMIKANPSLADQVVFVVNFDFQAMDGQYTYSEYAQYGIVQNLYEDENGQVHNDVYIDNEIDLETTFHSGESQQMEVKPCNGGGCCGGGGCEATMVSGLYKTMIPGLDKNEYAYYVDTKEGLKEVTMRFNSDGQSTSVKTRLSESEVRYREYLTKMVKYYQDQMYDSMKKMFGFSEDDELPVINKKEYKKLLKQAEKAGGIDKLSKRDQLAIAVFEADYDIMNIVSAATKNSGCGMGGNASFLDETTSYQMYAIIDGVERALYTNLNGEQLVQKLDADGNPVEGEFEYADGSGDYEGFDIDSIFEQRGYQNKDADGNLMFKDENGNDVTQVKGEDGTVKYMIKDDEGNQVEYSGDPDKLDRSLTAADCGKIAADVEAEVKNILDAVNNGEYPKGRTSNSTNSGDTETNDKADESEETRSDSAPATDSDDNKTEDETQPTSYTVPDAEDDKNKEDEE